MTERLSLQAYVTEDGACPGRMFLEQLPEELQAEAEALTQLYLEEGEAISGGRLIEHGKDLIELRGEHVRIFFKTSTNRSLIFIDGFLTSQGEAPLIDIHRKAEMI